MNSSLKRIKELILVLPDKDTAICRAYLGKRDFQSVFEIVLSDIYKARRKKPEELPDDYISNLIELEGELRIYMSYLEVPENYNNYE